LGLVFLFSLFACNGGQEPAKSPESSKSAKSARSAESGGPVPGWLDLHDLVLHRDTEAVAPTGLYIKGNIGTGNKFTPTSKILGKPIARDAGARSSPGWVDLVDQTFHQMQESVAPKPPYVKGVMDAKSKFYPEEPHEIIKGPSS